MNSQNTLSKRTSRRWWLAAVMLVIMLGLTFSNIYFLLYPNGYQGGRNPNYNTVIIFDRFTWDSIHVWTGFAIIIALLIHIMWHLDWIGNMFKRCKTLFTCRIGSKNPKAWLNIAVDLIAAIAFLVAAVTGVVLFVLPSGRGSSQIVFLSITKEAWRVIHDWSGILMLGMVFIHYLIHWRWVRKVSGRILRPRKTVQQTIAVIE